MKELYGAELGDLEVLIFEGTYAIVESVNRDYEKRGLRLKDKDRTSRNYHRLIRENFLKSLHLEIVHFEDIAIKKAMEGVVGQVMLSIRNREKYIESLVK